MAMVESPPLLKFGGDRGYRDEGRSDRRDKWDDGGVWKDRYNQYHKASEQSKVDEQAYKSHLRQVHRSPRMPLPGYVGDQRGYTTPGQHQALAGLAGQAADSSMSAYVQRIDFSLDQIGHNKYQKVLQSHNNTLL